MICEKIDAMICGTAKGGTSTLFKILSKYETVCVGEKGICFPNSYEMHFFETEQFRTSTYNKGYHWYHKRFRPSEGQIVIEKSPSYMFCPESVDMLREYADEFNPDLKLVFILRNPVQRAYSHYKMLKRNGWKKDKTFLQSFKEGDTNIVDRGYYYEQLKRFFDVFPSENIFICTLDELKREPQELFKRLTSFLGIDFMYSLDYNKKFNVGRKPRFILLNKIGHFFIHHINERIGRWINQISSWKGLYRIFPNKKGYKSLDKNLELKEKCLRMSTKKVIRCLLKK